MHFPDLASFIVACAPLVDASTVHAVVMQESGGNPFAIGVVGDALVRQPRTLPEAIATAAQLQRDGRRFSVGLGQIYVGNWAALGLTVERAFEPCDNLRSLQRILGDCYTRALPKFKDQQSALRASFSCYYSNNFSTGFKDGYVQSVVRHAERASHRRDASKGEEVKVAAPGR